MTVLQLAKPTVSEEAKASVIEFLEQALAEARAGEIVSAAIVKRRADDHWCFASSKFTKFSEAIGAFEIIKHERIAEYLREDNG